MHQHQKSLLNWYFGRSRELPWRTQAKSKKNPYAIWISEVMLQQTTSQAVIPFYEKFLRRFPTVTELAKAPTEEVLKYWAGLGYYQRARNLHKAAQILSRIGFAKTWEKLIELPGFGPYTARAVSSLAFEENVGLVDGNVIRVVSRAFRVDCDWWSPRGRENIQEKADQLVKGVSSSDMNQALMDLGATVCTPTSPSCWDCPWAKLCEANQTSEITKYPRAKPKRSREIWIWKPRVQLKSGKVALTKNDYAPFLKGQWILPGEVERHSKAPSQFDYKHVVTHHDIFVILDRKTKTLPKNLKWLKAEEVRGISPTSLVFKTLSKIHPEIFST